VTNKFFSSRGFGSIVDSSARVGETSLDGLGSTYTIEEYQPDEDVGGEFAIKTDLTPKELNYGYTAQSALTLYAPPSLSDAYSNSVPCFYAEVEAANPDILILNFELFANSAEISFFNYAFSECLTGDPVAILDSGTIFDGGYTLIGVFTGDDTLSIKLRSITSSFPPTPKTEIPVLTKIQSDRIKGNLNGLDPSRITFIELDKSLASTDYSNQKVFFNLDLPKGLNYIGSDQGGLRIVMVEFLLVNGEWEVQNSTGQSTLAVLLDSTDAEIKRTVSHTLSTSNKVRLRQGERVGVGIYVSKLAQNTGVGFLNFETTGLNRRDENNQLYGVNPPYLQDYALNDNQSAQSGTQVKVESAYQFFQKNAPEIYSGHVVKTIYQNKKGTAANIEGNFNFIFQRELFIYNFITESFEPRAATSDFRQAVITHLFQYNQIPLDRIDFDSLNAIDPIGGLYDFNYVFSSKKNKLLDEVAVMLAPYGGHVMRSGAFITFGHESGSKPIISTITGRK
jgi:hypothetical protein